MKLKLMNFFTYTFIKPACPGRMRSVRHEIQPEVFFCFFIDLLIEQWYVI